VTGVGGDGGTHAFGFVRVCLVTTGGFSGADGFGAVVAFLDYDFLGASCTG
jgi:hypothetical protein